MSHRFYYQRKFLFIWLVILIASAVLFKVTVVLAQTHEVVTHEELDHKLDKVVDEHRAIEGTVTTNTERITDLARRVDILEKQAMDSRVTKLETIVFENQIWLRATFGGIILLLVEMALRNISLFRNLRTLDKVHVAKKEEDK